VPTRPLPPDVRWDVGGWCPLDDTLLQQEPQGWSCPACGAAWDHAGRRGWWLTAGADLAARLQSEDALQTVGLLDPQQRSTCPGCRTWITPGHGQTGCGCVPVDTDEQLRRRRLDRRSAGAVAIAALTMFGTAAGLARLFDGQVSDVQWWAVAGGLVVAAVVMAAGWWLVDRWRRWWRGWWPYRHNRLLDTPLPRRNGTDVTGGAS
jgi:hypothetical protein